MLTLGVYQFWGFSFLTSSDFFRSDCFSADGVGDSRKCLYDVNVLIDPIIEMTYPRITTGTTTWSEMKIGAAAIIPPRIEIRIPL
jgi:hypothetical protein